MTGDVTRDLLMITVAKSAHQEILESNVKRNVVETALKRKLVTTLVECVRVDARTVLLVPTVINLALENILVEIVPRNAPITVNLVPVNTQTDGVLVLQDGQVKNAPQLFLQKILKFLILHRITPRLLLEERLAHAWL